MERREKSCFSALARKIKGDDGWSALKDDETMREDLQSTNETYFGCLWTKYSIINCSHYGLSLRRYFELNVVCSTSDTTIRHLPTNICRI